MTDRKKELEQKALANFGRAVISRIAGEINLRRLLSETVGYDVIPDDALVSPNNYFANSGVSEIVSEVEGPIVLKLLRSAVLKKSQEEIDDIFALVNNT